jgi:glyoxylase-like metal-dependent hydrolase (beta-lactamase superfamily II)
MKGLDTPLAVVGDVIFAGSVGGIRSRYRPALESIRAGVLTLPAETILLPGHGPLTTVAHELAHNPFFP